MASQTRPHTVKLSLSDSNELTHYCQKNGITVSKHLRALVKADIKFRISDEEKKANHNITLDIAIGLASLLHLGAQQESEVQIEIMQKANPILQKLEQLFSNIETGYK